MEPLTEKNGSKYYDRLPEGWEKASLDDFHRNGKKRLGMEFLIKWIIKEDYYQVCVVSETLTSTHLKPFIDCGRVFIKNQQP